MIHQAHKTADSQLPQSLRRALIQHTLRTCLVVAQLLTHHCVASTQPIAWILRPTPLALSFLKEEMVNAMYCIVWPLQQALGYGPSQLWAPKCWVPASSSCKAPRTRWYIGSALGWAFQNIPSTGLLKYL